MMVLILEDEQDISDALKAFLQEVFNLKDAIFQASSIKEAKSIIETHQIGIQIVDMTVTDGSTAKYIEETKDKIKTLISTADQTYQSDLPVIYKPYSFMEAISKFKAMICENSVD